ncbi:MAG: hypothetical protein NTV24_05235 [Candidatus Woesebacteria bacterium]|nr:hypothetical protein [Candidatus Woesebacteria bacterium]
MFWQKVTEGLSFTGVTEVSVWQDVFLGVLLIPIAVELLRKFIVYLDRKRPLKLLLGDFFSPEKKTLVFLSQLSAATESAEIITGQKYIVKFPRPLPSVRDIIGVELRQNIDPVWSEGDGECLASIFNIFGKAGKIEGLEVGDSIGDWSKWSNPTISIGFSPKTHKLIEKCEPVDFVLENGELSINGHDLKLNSYRLNDAAIIQKTYIKNNHTPVLLLAGLGTTGTSVAGYFFNKSSADLGKLYSDDTFCLLLSAKIDEGRESVVLRAAFPRPSFLRIVTHYPTFMRLNKDSIFPQN